MEIQSTAAGIHRRYLAGDERELWLEETIIHGKKIDRRAVKGHSSSDRTAKMRDFTDAIDRVFEMREKSKGTNHLKFI